MWLQRLARFVKAEDGPTSVEYAIMMALIIAVCFSAIGTVGSSTNTSFSNQSLKNATSVGS
jgi:pilus assembly protein Flp/PilA